MWGPFRPEFRGRRPDSGVVCVECLIGKQKKPTLFKVTEPSSIPYRTHPTCASHGPPVKVLDGRTFSKTFEITSSCIRWYKGTKTGHSEIANLQESTTFDDVRKCVRADNVRTSVRVCSPPQAADRISGFWNILHNVSLPDSHWSSKPS